MAEQSSESQQTATWRPPHGPKTKAVAWLILVAIAVCLITMVAIILLSLIS